jgi:hypothetical protein
MSLMVSHYRSVAQHWLVLLARQNNAATATQLVAADSAVAHSPVQTHYQEPVDLLSDAIAKDEPLEAVETLIKAGLQVNPVNTLNNKKPLHKAAHHLRLDVAELLLQHGADATAALTSGWCAYHNAILQLFNVHGYNVSDEPPERDSPKNRALQTVQLLVRSYVHASSAAVDVEAAKCPSKPGKYFTADMQQFAKQQLQQAVAQRAVQQQQQQQQQQHQAALLNSSAASDADRMLYDSMDADLSFSSSEDSAWLNSSNGGGSSAYTDAYSSSGSGSSSSNSMMLDGVDFSAEMQNMSSSTTTTTTAASTTTGATVVTTAGAAITTTTSTAAAAAATTADDASDADVDGGWDTSMNISDYDIGDLDSLLDSVNDAECTSQSATAGVKRPRLD